MITDAGKRPSLAPRNWGGWLLVGILWLVGKAPVGFGVWCSKPMGALLCRAMKRRRLVARRNIERCFPEYEENQVDALVRANFQSLARTLFEMGWCWGMRSQRFERLGRIEGVEHLRNAQAEGRGVLLITSHITCLEMGGRFACEAFPISGVYRPLGNEVLEWYQNRGRLSYAKSMISKREMRSVIRYLRKGGLLWYAPDQDFGPKQSVFVPFFGIQTATLEATHKLVALTGCAVVPMFPEFLPDENRYIARVHPPLPDFPSEDVRADLARLNAIMEEHIRRVPEQYWWIHRRFKSRPEGEAPFYD